MQTFSNAGNSPDFVLPTGENGQSETISKVKFAWLAGILDGEGHIVLFKEKKTGMLRINIGITSSDARMLHEVSKILVDKEIKFYYQLKKGNCSFCVTIIVFGQKNAEKFLRTVYPYLINKKDQAKTMLDFLEYRKKKWQRENPNHLGEDGKFKKIGNGFTYSEIDEEFYWKLRKQKKPPIDLQRLTRKASQILPLR